MVFDFDRFLSLNEIDQIYSISMNGNEMMVFLSEGERKRFPSDTIIAIITSIICKEARKWKNSLLYASATARVIYHGNT